MFFRIFNRLLLSIYILLLSCFLFYSFIFTGDSNHSSFDIIKEYIYFLAFAFVSSILISFFLKEKKEIVINKFHFIILAFFTIIIVLCDFFNIMISYDSWIERGMPN